MEVKCSIIRKSRSAHLRSLQFVVLRNKLRQAAKTLLLALAPRMDPHDGRPMSSKLD